MFTFAILCACMYAHVSTWVHMCTCWLCFFSIWINFGKCHPTYNFSLSSIQSQIIDNQLDIRVFCFQVFVDMPNETLQLVKLGWCCCCHQRRQLVGIHRVVLDVRVVRCEACNVGTRITFGIHLNVLEILQGVSAEFSPAFLWVKTILTSNCNTKQCQDIAESAWEDASKYAVYMKWHPNNNGNLWSTYPMAQSAEQT